MTVTPAIRTAICAELEHYTDKAAFVSDLSLSGIWGDTPDADIPQSRIKLLSDIWEDYQCTITDLLSRYNMRIIDFAAYFNIPYRTVQNWYNGNRMCPQYVTAMASEILRHNSTRAFK